MARQLIFSPSRPPPSLEPLLDALAEAVAWCERWGTVEDPRGSLRRLSDPVNVQELGQLRLSPEELVDRVCWSRHRQLAAAELTAPHIPWDDLPGRLLVFFPDDETWDGGAEGQTGGLFDLHNTPPWDTWVGYLGDVEQGGTRDYVNGYLLAYVPSTLVALAERGIAANPERCIQWLEDSETALAALLDRARS